MTLSNALEIGRMSKLELSSAVLTHYFGEYMLNSGDKNAFFQFLTDQFIPPFDFMVEQNIVI
jgi:hypothetical protein